METKPLVEALSYAGVFFALLSIGVYFRQVMGGRSTPNPATWLIWVLIGVINTATYFFVVKGNVIQSLTLIAVNGGVLLVAFYSLIKGTFAPIGKLEKLALLIAVGVGILWKTSGDPILANLVLQAVYVVSFVPTVVGVRNGILKEGPLPWTLALFPYLAMILAIGLEWSTTHWVALAHPILNGLLGNGLVVYYSLKHGPPPEVGSSPPLLWPAIKS